MNQLYRLQDFFATQLAQTSVWEFVLNLVLSAVLAFIIARFYVKYGNSLSNRRAFSANFIMLAMSTMLIITIVRSSLALSLGLIGALSIVRFRAAIKEPEELSYLFLIIAVGLGLGAHQRVITIVAVITILAVLRFKSTSLRNRSQWEQNLYLNLTTHNPHKLELERVNEVLGDNCSLFRMKRIDKTDEIMEACFLVEFKRSDSLQSIETSLRQADDSIKLTFLDFKGESAGMP